MGSLTVDATADVSGALADGTAESLLADLTDRITQRIADEAMNGLKSFDMDKTGRAHGGFQSSLKQVGMGSSIVIPGPMITGVTWAPWLEGTSSRNSSTGFKGYKLFAKTARALNAGKAGQVADDEVAKYVAEIGGA
jgi:hypothetical protein